MTIEIDRPEVEALIQERLLEGGFKDPQDVILHALRASQTRQRPSSELLAALRSSPSENAEEAPDWLRKTWAGARDSGLAGMIMDEIDAEIAAARLARRQPRP